MHELMDEMFTRSKLLILNFADLPSDIPKVENIQKYFEYCRANSIDPTLPESRQNFNNRLLSQSHYRYLVSRYDEDRTSMLQGSTIAAQGRTYHLGIDIFSVDLETVYAPCDGTILEIGNEPENHSFGHYLILKPRNSDIPYIFIGHLSAQIIAKSGDVRAGQPIATLGDYVNHENGGWSRHLHLQMLAELSVPGHTPPGYSTKADLALNSRLYPNPLSYFPEWNIYDNRKIKDSPNRALANGVYAPGLPDRTQTPIPEG